ncbi:hemopexin repeat-containing protein, partial [Mycolicibacterium porcinum]|uniref:hemopexin repeat-containing protein n=1 Tax=Mycolicibacterium porcinum TaxID=39693 RepID=UPI00197C1DFA
GSEYLRYDIATDQVDAGYPKPIKDNWASNLPAEYESGIDHVVIRNNQKAYFFKGSQYIRYDIATSRVDNGYPKQVAGNWPGLWADGVGRPD